MTKRAAHRRPRVDVRIGPRGRKLLVEGTFASWYVPGKLTTGSVWDAIALPLLLLPPHRRRSVLLLGLGGGSAARVVRALAPRAHIVGVERDPEVLRAARRWFDLDALGIEVVCEDARRALSRGRRRFDAVLDDVFVGSGQRVRKPDWLPQAGIAAAARRVAPGGILVSNTLDESAAVARELARHFPSALKIEVSGYDNRILVGAFSGATATGLRSAATVHPVTAPVVSRFSFRTLPAGAPRRRDGKVSAARTGTASPPG